MLEVKRATSRADNPGTVAKQLAAGAGNQDACLALVFASPRYDCDALADALATEFAPVPVYGCTTAGEIGDAGFTEGSAVAMTIASDQIRVGAGLGTELTTSPLGTGRAASEEAARSLGLESKDLSMSRHIGMCLIDGRSGQEESFVAGAAGGVAGIRIVGGSASDVLAEPPAARLLCEGRAHKGAGLVLMFESDIPFSALMSQHMIPTEGRMIVTASDPAERLVHELDGWPARKAYAEFLGVPPSELDDLATISPFGYYVGGRAYVRSLMGVEGDSLRFACAIETGVVLKPMRAGDILKTTADALEETSAKLGGIGALIAFNCAGRYFETQADGKTAALGEIMTRYPVIGFNTFGEQYNALHVNHTLTALAFANGAHG